jgi:hypothetical protein
VLPLLIRMLPEAPEAVKPVPPLPTATVPVTFDAVPLTLPEMVLEKVFVPEIVCAEPRSTYEDRLLETALMLFCRVVSADWRLLISLFRLAVSVLSAETRAAVSVARSPEAPGAPSPTSTQPSLLALQRKSCCPAGASVTMINSLEAEQDVGVVAAVTALIGSVLVAALASSVPPVTCVNETCEQTRVPSAFTSLTYWLAAHGVGSGMRPAGP